MGAVARESLTTDSHKLHTSYHSVQSCVSSPATAYGIPRPEVDAAFVMDTISEEDGLTVNQEFAEIATVRMGRSRGGQGLLSVLDRWSRMS